MIIKNDEQPFNVKNYPCETRDENGLTLKNADVLRKSVESAKNSSKSFKKGLDIIENMSRTTRHYS